MVVVVVVTVVGLAAVDLAVAAGAPPCWLAALYFGLPGEAREKREAAEEYSVPTAGWAAVGAEEGATGGEARIYILTWISARIQRKCARTPLGPWA